MRRRFSWHTLGCRKHLFRVRLLHCCVTPVAAPVLIDCQARVASQSTSPPPPPSSVQPCFFPLLTSLAADYIRFDKHNTIRGAPRQRLSLRRLPNLRRRSFAGAAEADQPQAALFPSGVETSTFTHRSRLHSLLLSLRLCALPQWHRTTSTMATTESNPMVCQYERPRHPLTKRSALDKRHAN